MKILLISALFVHLKSFSQTDSLISTLLNNDSIRYEVIRKAEQINPSSIGKVSISYIKIELSKDFKKYLLKQKTDFWLWYLSNEKSDWAANLVLYSLYKRDAALLAYVYTDRNKWLKIKDKDIGYWKDFLNWRNTKQFKGCNSA